MFSKHPMFSKAKPVRCAALAKCGISVKAPKISWIMIELAKYSIEMAFYAKIWTFRVTEQTFRVTGTTF